MEHNWSKFMVGDSVFCRTNDKTYGGIVIDVSSKNVTVRCVSMRSEPHCFDIVIDGWGAVWHNNYKFGNTNREKL